MTPAPYESCVACFRGDTTTAFALQGEAEWIIAALHTLTGMSIEEAEGTFLVFCERDLGCDPGKVPGGEITTAFRLCKECAASKGVAVGNVSGDVPGYRESA